MSCILHIETSTNVCSVAVSHDGTVIFEKEDFSGPNHAEQLGVYVDEALSFIDQSLIPLDAVAVSAGPGSYTGLRIGVSMAKGICYGRDARNWQPRSRNHYFVRCSMPAVWRFMQDYGAVP